MHPRSGSQRIPRHSRLVSMTGSPSSSGGLSRSLSGSGSNFSQVVLRRKPTMAAHLFHLPRPRSCNLSDNGGPSSPMLCGPRKSIEEFPNGRGLRLLQRTMSLSIDGKQLSPSRAHSLSEAPSSSGNYSSGILAGFDSFSPHHSSASNLMRIRKCAKGQSCPNLYSIAKDLSLNESRRGSQQRRAHGGHRRSMVLSPGAEGARAPSPRRATDTASTAPKQGSPQDSPRSSPSVHHLPAHLRCESRKQDHRRWSLPSSGYGTNTSESSNVSSQCSSKENLNPAHHAQHSTVQQEPLSTCHSSTESNPTVEESGHSSPFRPRSRSLSSPARSPGGVDQDIILMNSVYQERFPKAVAQMEERLRVFVTELENEQVDERNAVVRYVKLQILGMANDCLDKSKNQQLSTRYFFQVTEKVDCLVDESREKSPESLSKVYEWGRRLLIAISRAARLLECLEFDPQEFIELLEVAEDQVRKNIKTDIPKYIIEKLGLKNDPMDNLEIEVSAEHCSISDSASGNTFDSTTAFKPQKFIEAGEEDFQVIKLISNGAYGAVHLVRHRQSRQRFAMKKIKKQHLMLRNQVEQAFAERDILTLADNPFVVSLFLTFETKKYLCMVMEFVEGGDCESLLKQIEVLPLDMARMYFAEMVLALEYLHCYGIVHRDLKPSNLLISSEGHLKLTDFGLSKIGLMALATNLYESGMRDCHMFRDAQIYGTPEYIAPEVILRQGYGKPVDWWASGIILYQFLVGCVPFIADSAEELFMLLVADEPPEMEWPEDDDALAPDVVDLIMKLLERDPFLRLGTSGSQEVKDHPFFAGLDWNGLLKDKAAFVPQLDHEEDTSYFDPRSERYNHESNSDEDEQDDSDDPMFHSFGSYSPRFSQRLGDSDSGVFIKQQQSSSPPLAPPPVVPEKSPIPLRTRADSSPAAPSSAGSLRRTSSLRRPPVSPLAGEVAVTRSPSAHQLPAKTATCPLPDSSPVVMNKGIHGYGFTVRAIRVYQGDSDRFLLHHLVVFVQLGSPAAQAGMRIGDLVTHVNDVPVTGLPHPEVIALILQGPSRLTIRSTPLSQTSIRSDGRPRTLGRMIRRSKNSRPRRAAPVTPLRYRVPALRHADSSCSSSGSSGPNSPVGQKSRPQSLYAPTAPLSIVAPVTATPRTRLNSVGSGPPSPRRKSVHSVPPSPLARSPNAVHHGEAASLAPAFVTAVSPAQPVPLRRPMRGRHNTQT